MSDLFLGEFGDVVTGADGVFGGGLPVATDLELDMGIEVVFL
jgi:hypothetical protein